MKLFENDNFTFDLIFSNKNYTASLILYDFNSKIKKEIVKDYSLHVADSIYGVVNAVLSKSKTFEIKSVEDIELQGRFYNFNSTFFDDEKNQNKYPLVKEKFDIVEARDLFSHFSICFSRENFYITFYSVFIFEDNYNFKTNSFKKVEQFLKSNSYINYYYELSFEELNNLKINLEKALDIINGSVVRWKKAIHKSEI